MSDNLELGKRLRQARVYLGYSKRQVADALQLGSANRLGTYENGQVRVPAVTLDRLARLYSRPVEWFLRGDQADDRARALDLLGGRAATLDDRDIAELAKFVEFLRHRKESKR